MADYIPEEIYPGSRQDHYHFEPSYCNKCHDTIIQEEKLKQWVIDNPDAAQECKEKHETNN